ncbi:MAG: biopolymer transporter Tol, partial [Ignavibacteria bacterium]|nr:biopolymer transporter Tol [Ignavibacteria bacterium]
FWPDMALYKDPDEFSKRLTDHRKDGGFYNTSPAISPQGDKIAFISNRDFYFDIYIMDANDGKKVDRIIKGNRSVDFEELNILTPGLSWSPDGKKIALAAKRNGVDVIYVYDIAGDDVSILPLRFGAIGTVNWAPDNNKIVFAGQGSSQSDVYVYDIAKDKLENITNDIFSDSDPSFSPDGKTIFFASDRGEYVDTAAVPENFRMYEHNFSQNDLYSVEIDNRKITRLTNTPHCDEASPIVSADGKEVIFVSDKNGINNIYRKKIVPDGSDSAKTIESISEQPITNSLNGLYQPTISKDGKKLAFASMYQSAYNIFLMNNPYDISLDKDSLQLTKYMESILVAKKSEAKKDSTSETKVDPSPKHIEEESSFSTGVFIDTSSVKKDYSNFIFGKSDYLSYDSTEQKPNELFNPKANLDAEGNFKVNRYKVTFTPDIIYANAGFSSMYGLLGTTVISFSDVLGNHRLIGQTSMQIDLKNSDYGLAYYYLPNKLDLGFEGFHTARFVYLQRGNEVNLFRFRNYGGSLSISY